MANLLAELIPKEGYFDIPHLGKGLKIGNKTITITSAYPSRTTFPLLFVKLEPILQQYIINRLYFTSLNEDNKILADLFADAISHNERKVVDVLTKKGLFVDGDYEFPSICYINSLPLILELLRDGIISPWYTKYFIKQAFAPENYPSNTCIMTHKDLLEERRLFISNAIEIAEEETAFDDTTLYNVIVGGDEKLIRYYIARADENGGESINDFIDSYAKTDLIYNAERLDVLKRIVNVLEDYYLGYEEKDILDTLFIFSDNYTLRESEMKELYDALISGDIYPRYIGEKLELLKYLWEVGFLYNEEIGLFLPLICTNHIAKSMDI